jgi:hypothetical protein
MPLDLSIYRGVTPQVQQPDSPLDIMQKVANLRDSQALAQQRQDLVQARLQASRNQAQIQQIMSGPEDMDAKIQKLYAVDPKTAEDVQKSWDTTRKAAVDFNDTLNEHASRALALYDPKNPDSWGHTQAVASAIYQMAGKPVPQEWQGPPPDEATVNRWRQTSLSVKEQNEALKKKYEMKEVVGPDQKTVTLQNFDPSTGQVTPVTDAQGQPAISPKTIENARQAAKDARDEAHQGATEAIARGQLGVAQGNLGIRQKELALQQQKRADELAKGTEGVKLPAATAQVVAGLEQSESIINELQGVKGKDEWLGPVAGRKAEFMLKVPGWDVPDDQARFIAQTATLKNSVIKAITGAQMSENEATRILQQVPLLTDKPNVWEQKAEATKANAIAMRKRILALSGGSPDTAPAATTTTPRFKIISVK